MNYLNCNIVQDIENQNGAAKIIYSFPLFALDNIDLIQPSSSVSPMIEFGEKVSINSDPSFTGIDFYQDMDTELAGISTLVMQEMGTSILGGGGISE